MLCRRKRVNIPFQIHTQAKELVALADNKRNSEELDNVQLKKPSTKLFELEKVKPAHAKIEETNEKHHDQALESRTGKYTSFDYE